MGWGRTGSTQRKGEKQNQPFQVSFNALAWRSKQMNNAIASTPTFPSTHYLNATYGIRSWLLTTDHKRIALLYVASVTFFFMLGGIFAFIIRLNLLTPQG